MSALKTGSPGRNNGVIHWRVMAVATLGLALLGAVAAQGQVPGAGPKSAPIAEGDPPPLQTVPDKSPPALGVVADEEATLPVAPKNQPEPAPLLGDDLKTVPQIVFQ